MIAKRINLAWLVLVVSVLTACGQEESRVVCNQTGHCYQTNVSGVNSLSYSNACRINDGGQCYSTHPHGYCTNTNSSNLCVFYKY